MHVLSMRTSEGLSLVAAIRAPAGWASLGWAGCETNVAIPPSWEPETRFAELRAKAVNRGGYGAVHPRPVSSSCGPGRSE